MNSSTTEKRPAVRPPPIAARYEALRLAALGEPLPPDARSGLVLFLRRGMWGWARALADGSVPRHPSPSPSSNPTAAHQHRTVIQVFAAMALSSNTGRVQ